MATTPDFTPQSLMGIAKSGCIYSTDNIRKELKMAGFGDTLYTSASTTSKFSDYCISETDLARLLTFDPKNPNVINSEWFNALLMSPRGNLCYISFSRECGQRYISGSILRDGRKTCGYSTYENEITMYMCKLKNNNIDELKGNIVLSVKDSNFVVQNLIV